MRFQSLGLVLVGLVAGVVVGTWGSGSGLLSGGPNIAAAQPAGTADPGTELPFHIKDCTANDCEQTDSIQQVGNSLLAVNAAARWRHHHSCIAGRVGPCTAVVSNMTVNTGGTLDLSALALMLAGAKSAKTAGVPLVCNTYTCFTITMPEVGAAADGQRRKQTLWIPVPTGLTIANYSDVLVTCYMPEDPTKKKLPPCAHQ
jgi:hypothetical protein